MNGIHERVLANIPSDLSQPDGVQHIRWISHEVSGAWQNVTRAYSRLIDFLNSGTIPEDLKNSVLVSVPHRSVKTAVALRRKRAAGS